MSTTFMTDIDVNNNVTSYQEHIEAYKHMGKKDLELNFDRFVALLQNDDLSRDNQDVLCDLLDVIAHELYVRVNKKLH